MSEKTLGLINEHDARWVDLRFTDTRGKEQHVTNSASKLDEEFFENGAMFDGSSIAGWKPINDADMILMPDDATAVVDPFTEEKTINLRCDIIEPRDRKSTRLNSSHVVISYAVFCLKKKKIYHQP